MPRSNEQVQASEIAQIKRAVKDLQQGRLKNASMHGTRLYIYDDDGDIREVIGNQGDGSYGSRVVKSPPQPTTTAPALTSGELGAVEASWDGGIVQGDLPVVHGYVQVWSQYVGEDGSPDSDQARLVSTIRDRDGGATTIVCATPGVWAVWFRVVGADRVTIGEFSEPSLVEIESLVNTEEIEEALAEAEERLAEAEAKAQEALDEVGQVRDEWAEGYPRLQQELADAQAAVAAAETRLGQAEQDIADSRAGLEDLRDVRLPALELNLDGVESAVADYDTRIIAAQDGADSARQTAETLRDDTLPALEGRLVESETAIEDADERINDTRLGMENLRDIRVPELEDTLNSGLEDANEWREVGAISAESLRVGSWQDMIPDPAFSSTWWRFAGEHSIVPSYTRNSVTKGPVVVLPSAGSAMRTQRFKAIPGASYVLEFEHERSGSATGADYEVFVGGLDSAGGWVGSLLPHAVRNYATTAWGKESLSFTIPETLEGLDQWEVVWRTNAAPSVIIRIVNPSLRRKVDSQVIVDGSISARHIMAEEIAAAVGEFLHITAEQIDTEGLAAYLATIIQLDAEQITSGQISTARLDAEEVAGAVANFLTLDALEINVEQLAGEIANIIEITAESIASGSISTRHMAIADTENLFPQQAVEDLAANGDNTAPWSRIRGNTNRWYTVTGQGRGMRSIRINDGTASNARTTLEYAPGSSFGIQMSPGDSFRLTFYGWAGGSGAAPRISLLTRNAEGSFVGRPATATAVSGWREYELEVHNTDSEVRFLRVEFDVPAGVAMRGHWQDFKLRHMTNGELIVDGSIQARHIIAEEIAAAVAEFLELHAGQITAGQIDTDLLNVDDLAARIATVVELNASRITTGQLGAERINVADLYSDTAFINNLRAAVVTALEVTAERGFIGGALLEDNTITVNKLTALDEIMSELGRFLVVEADQINVNSLVAQTGLVGLIEAVGMTLSNEEGGRRFEVSGDGFRLTDTEDGHVIAQLGTQSDDLISLHDSETGEMVTVLSQDGGISSQALSVDSDPSFGGKRLAGDLYESPRWHASNSVFGMTGGHIVGHHRRSFDNDESGNTGNGQAIAHLEADLDPGRVYRVQCHDFEMRNRQNYFLEAFYTTSEDEDVRPAPPNRHSLTWGATPGRVPSFGEGHGTKLSFDRVVASNTIRRIRISFVVGINSGGDGTIRFGNLQRHAAHFTITDIGPNLGSSGADLWQPAGNSTASVPAPQSLLREPYPVARTATYTLSSSGVATRQYTNGEMRFGRWLDGNTYLTVVEFAPWNQTGVPQSVDLRFRVDRWRTAAGGIVQLGIPGFSGTPASFNYGNQVEALPAARNVGSVAPTRIDLDRDQQLDLASRTAASVVLGGGGWTSAPYPASGRATTSGVTAALSTDVSGQTTGEGDE